MQHFPDFMVIGAMRAGTTMLYDLLRAHPEVDMSREKETDFFIEGIGWERGLKWYFSQFSHDGRLTGEVSPNYTKTEAFPGVPERAAAMAPDARLIFVYRDPVKRAASQYRHARLSGAAVPTPDEMPGSHELQHLIDVSQYASQIAAWRQYYSFQQMLFLDFDELTLTPAIALTRLSQFLGISDVWPEAQSANSSDDLARLPGWVFKLRDSKTGRGMKSVLSAQARDQLKRLMMLRAPERTPDCRLRPETLEEIARATAHDQVLFQQILAEVLDQTRCKDD